MRSRLHYLLGALLARSAISETEKECGRFIEVLENLGHGTAYLGKMLLGNQRVDCLWDTSSDDTVVTSARTLDTEVPCIGALTCYDKDQSQTYAVKGRGFSEPLQYGSAEAKVVS